MSALLESLAAGFKGDQERCAQLADILNNGLPHPRSEAWKYTSLRTLERRTFSPADANPAGFDHALLDDIPAPRVVFVNGRFDPAHSDFGELPAHVQFSAATPSFNQASIPAGSDAVFARLNAILATTGAVVKVPANCIISAPLHVVMIGTETGADHAWHLRHRIELAQGAQVQLIEYHLTSGTHRHLDNSVLTVHLAESAQLTHARVQHGSEGASCFLCTDAHLQENSRYRRVDLELGSALMRHEFNLHVCGAGASVTANGILLATGRRHVDTRLTLAHQAGDTRCDLNWRGIASGRGRVVFHGGITIAEGADGSQAQLSSQNLLLSEHAEIDTQPTLIIHADDVKAAHGATVGQLDPQALFYLRARGIPLPDAQRLLTAAFARDPLRVLAQSPLHDCLQQRLDRALQMLSTP